eukprot:1373782-Pyramimonas_sp.AAC.1
MCIRDSYNVVWCSRTRKHTRERATPPPRRVGLIIHNIALNVHTIALNVHTVALNVHTVALNVHNGTAAVSRAPDTVSTFRLLDLSTIRPSATANRTWATEPQRDGRRW